MIRAGRSGGQPTHPGQAEPQEAVASDRASADDGGSAAARAEGPATTRPAFRRALEHAWFRHLALLLIYEGAGIAATWPRFTYLADSRLPATADVSRFLWNLWWT